MERLTTPSRDWKNYVGAIAAPFLLQIVIMSVARVFRLDAATLIKDPEYQLLSMLGICVATGFVFVVREFRWYSLVIGIIYFPLFGVLVAAFAVGVNAIAFHGP